MSEHEEIKKTNKHNGGSSSSSSKSKRRTTALANAEAATSADGGGGGVSGLITNVEANNKTENYTQATQFSVQSSGVDGLRMKISAIRPTTQTLNNNNNINDNDKNIILNQTTTIATPTTATTTTCTRTKIPSLNYFNAGNDANLAENMNNITTIATAAATAQPIATTLTTNSPNNSSLVVKISKTQLTTNHITTATTTLTTTHTPTSTTTGTTTKLCNFPTKKAFSSDNSWSDFSDGTSMTVTGLTLPSKKVKVKRKKLHNSKHAHKKRHGETIVSTKPTTTTTVTAIALATATTTPKTHKMHKRNFSSDSEDEQPLIKKRLNKQQLPQTTPQRAPRLLLTTINNKTMCNLNQNLLTTATPTTTLPTTLSTTATQLVGLNDNIGLSSSDNELPKLVSAAIERVARASESEDLMANMNDDDDDDDDLDMDDNEAVAGDYDDDEENFLPTQRTSKRLTNRNRSVKHMTRHKRRTTNHKRRLQMHMPQYQSTLLQDFMEKTQRLGQTLTPNFLNATLATSNTLATTTTATATTTTSATVLATTAATTTTTPTTSATKLMHNKKRRGRPKKEPTQLLLTTASTTTTATLCTTTATVATAAASATTISIHESADSGVISTASNTQSSSTPSPRRQHNTAAQQVINKWKSLLRAPAVNMSWLAGLNDIVPHIEKPHIPCETTTATKLDMAYLDKRMYATERVLYPPPRNKRRNTSAMSAATSVPNLTKDETYLDPMWRKIDVNKKFQRPSLSGYKSDGGEQLIMQQHSSNICSKVLAAKSGYVSDYGSYHARAIAHNSGYKSDASCKSRYSTKSCMSRRSNKRRHRGRLQYLHRHTHNNNQSVNTVPTKDEQDILQLAGLSLGHTSEESNENVCKPNLSALPTTSVSKKYGEIGRFVATGEYFGGRNHQQHQHASRQFKNKRRKTNNYAHDAAEERINLMRKQQRKMKSHRSSAISLCSYVSSNSKCKRRHRHRCTSVSHSTRYALIDSKFYTDMEILTNNMANLNLCALNHLNNNNSNFMATNRSRDVSLQAANRPRDKRAQKKRKLSEHVDALGASTSSAATLNLTGGGGGGTKRRHKKSQSSPDDHKLPLKKRHYLLSGPGDKQNVVTASAVAAAVAAKWYASNTQAWAAAAATAKTTACAKSQQQFCARKVNNSSASGNNSAAASPSAGLTPKKRHLLQTAQIEHKKHCAVASDVTATPTTTVATTPTTTNLNKMLGPTPGIFEPSVELEIQIPPIVTKSEVDSPLLLELNKNYAPATNNSCSSRNQIATPKTEQPRVVETLLNKTGGNILLKRRRRKFNRTGFPTVRRKKRKGGNEQILLDVTPDISAQVQQLQQQQQIKALEQQVPEVAPLPETNQTRTPRVSVVALERLQAAVPSTQVEQVSSTNLTSPVSTLRARKSERAPKPIVSEELPTVRAARVRRAATKLNLPEIKVEEAASAIKHESPTRSMASATTTSSKSLNLTPKINLPSRVKLPAGLDPNTNFCCKIRLKRSISALTDQLEQANENDEALPAETQDVLPLSECADNKIRKFFEQNVKPTKMKTLKAGLFSNYYKTNVHNLPKKTSTTKRSKFNNDVAQTTSQLLPPPIYCGEYLRERQIDFELPYSIWQHHLQQAKPLPNVEEADVDADADADETEVDVTAADTIANASVIDKIPCWNYRRIRTNCYREFTRNHSSAKDIPICNCKADMSCEDYCLNRLVYTECSPLNCPTKRRCRNQQIQNHDIAKGMELFMTEHKGIGLRAKNTIKGGTYIMEYVGEVVSEREFKHRMATIYVSDKHHYCLQLDGGTVIDGHRMGNDARFVNHSCQPNCEIQKWSVNGNSRMALFAKRRIEAGEELTYDYNFSLFNPAVGQPCKCMAPQCRGIIGGKSQRVTPLALNTNVKSLDSRPTKITNSNARKNKAPKTTLCLFRDIILPTQQPIQLPEKDKKIVKQQRIFLLRVYEKIKEIKMRKQKLKTLKTNNNETNRSRSSSSCRSLCSSTFNAYNYGKRAMTPSLAVQISALTSSHSMRTRGLTMAGNDPDMERMAKMTLILREIYSHLETLKDINDAQLTLNQIAFSPPTTTTATVATATTNTTTTTTAAAAAQNADAAKRKKPSKQNNLRLLRANIEQGLYQSPNKFDEDVLRIFQETRAMHTNNNNINSNNNNVVESTTTEQTDAEKTTPLKALDALLAAYEAQKHLHYEQLLELAGGDDSEVSKFKKQAEVVTPPSTTTTNNTIATPTTTSLVNTTPIKITPLSRHMHGNRKTLRGTRGNNSGKHNTNEDIIRCICGMYKDEGLMIQCAQCTVWQHTECTRADTNADRYLCEKCEPREVDREIALDEYKEEGHRYYLTLMRGDLHVRQGDAVYVLRDIPIRDAEGKIVPSKKHTYETIGKIDYQECDIFRVERLWKTEDGKRFIFGHHFLRPHETFHEPTRRFYPNEVVRVPLYEVVPIELVIGRCWVLDRNTFCKGRPIECEDESHCYICELRVDKSAHFFTKAKINYPTCTKTFAFRMFPEKLKISKTYAVSLNCIFIFTHIFGFMLCLNWAETSLKSSLTFKPNIRPKFGED